MNMSRDALFELPELHNRIHVFRDRAHAGRVLADMLTNYRQTDALVLGIPAGGVPVAAEIARVLRIALDVAVVSKITLPWNTEAGYGAVAFDGTVRLNEPLMESQALCPEDIENGIRLTREKVSRRVRTLRGNEPLPNLSRRPVILVDDGLASGFTMLVAIEALRKSGAMKILVAVPTAHTDAATRIGSEVEALYCPNIRTTRYFAVADAYEHWFDIPDKKVMELIQAHRESSTPLNQAAVDR